MFKSKLLVLLSLSLCLSFAHAADHAAPADVKALLQKNYAQFFGDVEQVNTTPIPGIYEVVTQGQIIYTDEEAKFIFDGNLIDLKERKNITEARARKLFAIDFKKLPLELAIKKVKGNGKRTMAYFTDPNCGFCKKLEQELKNVNDVTLYLFLYPIFEGSAEKAQAVWCSKDKVKAWDNLMLNGVVPPAANCDVPFDKTHELGRKYRVNGTPALIFTDGTLVPGYMPAAKLEEALNASK